MQIIEYFISNGKEKWITKLEGFDWSAAKFLAQILKEDKFDSKLGSGGKLFPWIGFVFIAPAYRGHRYSERVIEYACKGARIYYKTLSN